MARDGIDFSGVFDKIGLSRKPSKWQNMVYTVLSDSLSESQRQTKHLKHLDDRFRKKEKKEKKKDDEETKKSKVEAKDKKKKQKGEKAWYEVLLKQKYFQKTYGLFKSLPMMMISHVLAFLMLAVFDPTGSLMTSIINMVLNLGIMLLQMLVRMVPNLAGIIAKLIPVLINAIAVALKEIYKAAPIILEGIINAFDTLIGLLPGLMDAFINAALTLLPMVIQALIKLLPRVLTLLITYIVKAITFLGKALPMLIMGLVELVPVLIETLVTALPEVITALVQAIPKLIFAILYAIPEILTALVEAIPTIIMVLIDAIPLLLLALMEPKMLGKIMAAFLKLFLTLGKVLFTTLPEIFFKTIPSMVMSVMEGIGEMLDDLFGTTVFRDIFHWLGVIMTIMPRIFLFLFDFFSRFFSWTIGFLPAIIKPVVKWIKELPSEIMDFVVGAIMMYFDFIVGFWSTIFGGISAGVKWIWKWIRKLAKGIPWLDEVLQDVENAVSDFSSTLSDLWDDLKGMFDIGAIIAKARKKIEKFFEEMPGLKQIGDFFWNLVKKLKNLIADLPFMGGTKILGAGSMTKIFNTTVGDKQEVAVLTKLAQGRARNYKAVAGELGLKQNAETIEALKTLGKALQSQLAGESPKEIARRLKDQVDITKEMKEALEAIGKANSPGRIKISAATFDVSD